MFVSILGGFCQLKQIHNNDLTSRANYDNDNDDGGDDDMMMEMIWHFVAWR